MIEGKKSKTVFVLVGVIVACLAGASMLSGGLGGWSTFEAQRLQRAVFPEQKPEGHIYEATARGPVTLASFVRDLRIAWPDQSLATVHDAAGELATGLLHHSDIEVGSLDGTKFTPWPMPSWEAARKINRELKSMNDYLQDENRYVFRRR